MRACERASVLACELSGRWYSRAFAARFTPPCNRAEFHRESTVEPNQRNESEGSTSTSTPNWGVIQRRGERRVRRRESRRASVAFSSGVAVRSGRPAGLGWWGWNAGVLLVRAEVLLVGWRGWAGRRGGVLPPALVDPAVTKRRPMVVPPFEPLPFGAGSGLEAPLQTRSLDCPVDRPHQSLHVPSADRSSADPPDCRDATRAEPTSTREAPDAAQRSYYSIGSITRVLALAFRCSVASLLAFARRNDGT